MEKFYHIKELLVTVSTILGLLGIINTFGLIMIYSAIKNQQKDTERVENEIEKMAKEMRDIGKEVSVASKDIALSLKELAKLIVEMSQSVTETRIRCDSRSHNGTRGGQ